MIKKQKTIGSLFTRAKSALFSRTTLNDSPPLMASHRSSSLMTSVKRLALTCCLLGALSTTANAAVTYTGNFDSGTDSWEQKNAAGTVVNFTALVNESGGQSGNCIKIPEGGWSVGIRRLVTGVVAAEDFTYSIYYKIPSASGTWGTPPRAFVRQETSGAALVGSVQYSGNLTRNGTIL